MVQDASGCAKDSYSPQVERKTATVVNIEPASRHSDSITNEKPASSKKS
jgi:hypothetical protein